MALRAIIPCLQTLTSVIFISITMIIVPIAPASPALIWLASN